MNCILSIDIGTSSVKVILVSEASNILTSATESYELLTPRPNWIEQNPDTWWQATVKAIQTCLKKLPDSKIEAVGLTGQMHGSVFLGERGEILRPAILWCDQRTEKQCQTIYKMAGKDTLLEETGNLALTGFTAPKILWLRDNEPEIYRQLRRVLLPKDYIRYRLTGEYATEVSDASGTLLFNVTKRKWSDEILKALDLKRSLFPDCFESTYISGYLSSEAASLLGMTEGIPVAGGGGDQAAGAVGNGIIKSELATCAIGTSGVIFWHSDHPVRNNNGKLHYFCHAIPGKWHLMGVTLAAGGSLRWFRDVLAEDVLQETDKTESFSYEYLSILAEQAPAGSEGLIFLPYLAGERTPHADPNARGAFIGLSLRHNKKHLIRSVFEGITMSLKDCFELGKESGMAAKKIYLSGGGTRNDFWSQLIADILNIDTTRLMIDEGPAYGAAIIAGVGTGIFSSFEDLTQMSEKTGMIFNPEPGKTDLYKELFSLYKPLYNNLYNHYQNNSVFVNKYNLI